MHACRRYAPWIRQPSQGSLVHSHRDFRVRRSVVHRALNWLVTHNQYYRSNHVHIDVNALEQLPHDGNLSQLTAITVESAITEPPATGPPVADTPATSEDPYSAHLPQSFVPIATRSMTEQEAVHQSVQERQLSPSTSSSPATMMWSLLEDYLSISCFTEAARTYYSSASGTERLKSSGKYAMKCVYQWRRNRLKRVRDAYRVNYTPHLHMQCTLYPLCASSFPCRS